MDEHDNAITIIFQDINELEDYRIETIKNYVKKIGEEKSRETKKQSGGKIIYWVDNIIDPTIKIFEDKKGRNCMAILFGYHCSDDSLFHPEESDFEFIYAISREVSVMVSHSEIGGVLFSGLGICINNPFVFANNFRRFHTGREESRYQNQVFEALKKAGASAVQRCHITKEGTNEYIWLNLKDLIKGDYSLIDTSMVLSIFQELNITFPRGEDSGAELTFYLIDGQWGDVKPSE